MFEIGRNLAAAFNVDKTGVSLQRANQELNLSIAAKPAQEKDCSDQITIQVNEADGAFLSMLTGLDDQIRRVVYKPEKDSKFGLIADENTLSVFDSEKLNSETEPRTYDGRLVLLDNDLVDKVLGNEDLRVDPVSHEELRELVFKKDDKAKLAELTKVLRDKVLLRGRLWTRLYEMIGNPFEVFDGFEYKEDQQMTVVLKGKKYLLDYVEIDDRLYLYPLTESGAIQEGFDEDYFHINPKKKEELGVSTAKDSEFITLEFGFNEPDKVKLNYEFQDNSLSVDLSDDKPVD